MCKKKRRTRREIDYNKLYTFGENTITFEPFLNKIRTIIYNLDKTQIEDIWEYDESYTKDMIDFQYNKLIKFSKKFS